MPLKLITVSEFLTAPTTSKYQTDDRDYAVTFLNIINSNTVTNLDDIDIDQLEKVYLNQRENKVCYNTFQKNYDE